MEDSQRPEGGAEADRLRAEVERYQALFQATETAWALHEMVFDGEGRPVDYVFIDVNPAFERDTGLTAEVCVGKRVTELIPDIADADPDLISMYGEVVSSGEPIRFELYFEPFDRWYRVTASRPYEGHFIAAFEEITKRKRAEAKLHESETRFRHFFESAPDYCYMIDPEGLVVDANPAAFEALGYERDELVGEPIRKVYAPETLDRMRLLFEWWRKTGRLSNEEITLLTKAGERRTVLLSAAAVHDQAGELIHSVSMQRDITQRKAMENLLERTAAELARSNEDLEQFAYVASHDLQEPLRMVASYVTLLEQRYRGKLDEDADTFIDFAVDGARRMQALISDLLAYSRVDRRGDQFEEMNASACLDDALHALTASLEDSGARIERGDLPTIAADARQLTQVLQNVVGNAVKFRKPDVPPVVSVEASRDGDDWVFTVRDNGIGIEKRHRERVFEIFQRLHTRAAYEGTGLGLALCRRIIERHGGRIWLEGDAGDGTTVRFTLPAA